MTNEQIADRVVEYMNDLLEKDRPAIGAMIANRIPCNEELANHPTCQVRSQHGGFHVGLLGLLNGLCGIFEDGPKKGFGLIAAAYDDDDHPHGYKSLVRFERVKNVITTEDES